MVHKSALQQKQPSRPNLNASSSHWLTWPKGICPVQTCYSRALLIACVAATAAGCCSVAAGGTLIPTRNLALAGSCCCCCFAVGLASAAAVASGRGESASSSRPVAGSRGGLGLAAWRSTLWILWQQQDATQASSSRCSQLSRESWTLNMSLVSQHVR